MKKRVISLLVIIALMMSCVAVYGGTALAVVEQTGDIKLIHSMDTMVNNYKGARCTKSVEYGIGGKAEDDRAVRYDCVSEYTDTSWYAYYSSFKKTGYGDYLVFEASLFMNDKVDTFYIGSKQHNALGATVRSGSHYLPYQWCKYVIVFDINDNTADTYFNGELVENGYATKFTKTISRK